MRIPVLLLSVIFLNCGKAKVDPENVQKMISEGYQILDVRTSAEYKTGHIASALNVDVSAPNFKELAEKLDRKKKYIVHCSANLPNGRTDRAIQSLHQLGFDNLVSLRGGIAAWQQQSLPVVTK